MYTVSAKAGVLGLIPGNYFSSHNAEMFLNPIAT